MALFYLWGSFIRGLHPCLCYFVPPGLCFSKISMDYQEYFFSLPVYFVFLGLCLKISTKLTKNLRVWLSYEEAYCRVAIWVGVVTLWQRFWCGTIFENEE